MMLLIHLYLLVPVIYGSYVSNINSTREVGPVITFDYHRDTVNCEVNVSFNELFLSDVSANSFFFLEYTHDDGDDDDSCVEKIKHNLNKNGNLHKIKRVECSLDTNNDNYNISVALADRYLIPWTCGYSTPEEGDFFYVTENDDLYNQFALKGLEDPFGVIEESKPYHLTVTPLRHFSSDFDIVFGCKIEEKDHFLNSLETGGFAPPLKPVTFTGPNGFHVTGDLYGRFNIYDAPTICSEIVHPGEKRIDCFYWQSSPTCDEEHNYTAFAAFPDWFLFDNLNEDDVYYITDTVAMEPLSKHAYGMASMADGSSFFPDFQFLTNWFDNFKNLINEMDYFKVVSIGTGSKVIECLGVFYVLVDESCLFGGETRSFTAESFGGPTIRLNETACYYKYGVCGWRHRNRRRKNVFLLQRGLGDDGGDIFDRFIKYVSKICKDDEYCTDYSERQIMLSPPDEDSLCACGQEVNSCTTREENGLYSIIYTVSIPIADLELAGNTPSLQCSAFGTTSPLVSWDLLKEEFACEEIPIIYELLDAPEVMIEGVNGSLDLISISCEGLPVACRGSEVNERRYLHVYRKLGEIEIWPIDENDVVYSRKRISEEKIHVACSWMVNALKRSDLSAHDILERHERATCALRNHHVEIHVGAEYSRCYYRNDNVYSACPAATDILVFTESGLQNGTLQHGMGGGNELFIDLRVSAVEDGLVCTVIGEEGPLATTIKVLEPITNCTTEPYILSHMDGAGKMYITCGWGNYFYNGCDKYIDTASLRMSNSTTVDVYTSRMVHNQWAPIESYRKGTVEYYGVNESVSNFFTVVIQHES